MFPHQKLDWTLRRLETRLDEAPDDAAARLDFALACLSKAWFHEGGEVWFNRALTQGRRVLQGDPSSPGGLVVAGASLVGLDRVEPGTRYLDEALKLAPERPEVHLALGWLHDRQGDRRAAVRSFESACRLAPESWEPHALLGRLLGERADELGTPHRLHERSQFHIVRALQLGPSPALMPPLLSDLGIACLRSGRYSEAYKIFQRLQEHERYRAKARYHLGLVSYHLGRYKNAILFLRQHLEVYPENPHVHARIGMAYLHLGEVSKARESCNRALAIDPDHLQARWTLGCALLEEGLLEDATRLFKEILHDAPGHLPAFTELVRLRTEAGDARWLRQALRAEVSVHDRLPLGTGGDSPRAATRARIEVILRILGELQSDEVPAILEAMDVTTDEGLRFRLWEAALDLLAARRAREVVEKLKSPGTGYGVAAAREALALASVIPEPLLTRGLQVAEDDLKRAAVDRHGPASDVGAHRNNIERERQEARAWQALLLLAVAARQTRSGRNLLVRWASDADADLGDAARAALAMLGDAEAADRLRQRARTRGAEHLVDALLAQVSPPEARLHPRPVSDDEELHCSTCGRRAAEVDHMLAGGDAVICDQCMMGIARDRRELQTEDPAVACALCARDGLESRGVYVQRGIPVCASCLDHSLGMLEREEVDRFLAAW